MPSTGRAQHARPPARLARPAARGAIVSRAAYRGRLDRTRPRARPSRSTAQRTPPFGAPLVAQEQPELEPAFGPWPLLPPVVPLLAPPVPGLPPVAELPPVP